MTLSVFYMNKYLDAVQQASREWACNLLGIKQVELCVHSSDPEKDQSRGAFVPFVSEDGLIQIGIVCSFPDCKKLASKYRKSSPEEQLTEEDIDNVLRETAVFLAKRCQVTAASSISESVGLPILLKGYPPFCLEGNSLIQSIRLENIECSLMVLYHII